MRTVYYIATCPRPPYNRKATDFPCNGGNNVIPGEICFAQCPYDNGIYRIKCLITGTWSGLEMCQPGMYILCSYMTDFLKSSRIYRLTKISQ